MMLAMMRGALHGRHAGRADMPPWDHSAIRGFYLAERGLGQHDGNGLKRACHGYLTAFSSRHGAMAFSAILVYHERHLARRGSACLRQHYRSKMMAIRRLAGAKACLWAHWPEAATAMLADFSPNTYFYLAFIRSRLLACRARVTAAHRFFRRVVVEPARRRY